MKPITPFLWFDSNAEEAAGFYVSLFPGSKIVRTTRYTEAGREQHGRQPGSVMTVEFELNGQHFTALNGGPLFQFNESVSFVVRCKDQEEIDRYWEKLGQGGTIEQCGWLRDKYGLCWQVSAAAMGRMMKAPDKAAAKRVCDAMLTMTKIDIAGLERAFRGG